MVVKARDKDGTVTREPDLRTGLKSGDRTTAGTGATDDDDNFALVLDVVNPSELMAAVVVVSVVGVAAVATDDTTQSGNLVKAVVETGS